MVVTDYDYVNYFTPRGSLHLGPQPTVGRAALAQAHDMLFDPTTGPMIGSKHFVDRLFTLPVQSGEKVEVVVTGLHEIVLRDGSKLILDFASWIIMTEGHDEGYPLQAEHWRVFRDDVKLVAGIEKLPPIKGGPDSAPFIERPASDGRVSNKPTFDHQEVVETVSKTGSTI